MVQVLSSMVQRFEDFIQKREAQQARELVYEYLRNKPNTIRKREQIIDRLSYMVYKFEDFLQRQEENHGAPQIQQQEEDTSNACKPLWTIL